MTMAVFFSYVIFWLIALLYVSGFFGMMEHHHLVKKLMAMNLMQTAVILFFLVLGQKIGGVTPIAVPGLTDPDAYVNPLPQALMLTAIVVNLSTTGTALAFLIVIKKHWNTLDESEIMRRMDK